MISEEMKKNLVIDNMALIPNLDGKTLSIDISGICNMDCIYCFYSAANEHKNAGFIDPELFFRVSRQAYELGVRKVGLYLQGEPLLNPRLIEYIRYLKELGYEYIYISTNGIGCDKKRIEEMVNAGLDSLKFSISGFSQDSYKKHHGVDKFSHVLENIKSAYEFRKESSKDFKIYIFFIKTKQNQDEIPEMLEQLNPYVDEIAVHPVANSPMCLLGIDEYLGVEKQSYYSKTPPCAEVFNRVSVSVDGFLLSCCGPIYDTNKIASLHDMSLEDAWSCDEFIEFRRRHINGDIKGTLCERCMNGVVEVINPLTRKYNFTPLDLPFVDITQKVKNRFEL